MTETKDQIKTKVLQWLNEEDRSPTELDDPSTELNIAVPIQENGSISVIFRREKKDSVYLVARISFSPLDKQAFSKLPPDRKKSFTDELNHLLLLVNVEYSLLPNAEIMESVNLSKAIYFDALTKDRFFDTILLIRRSIEIAKWCYGKHLGHKSSTGTLFNCLLL
jgi:hypothetical protein